MMAGNTLVMHNSEQITHQLPYQKAKFRWGSIDTDFQNGEVTVSLALLTVKAANMLVTRNRKHIQLQSPYLHYQI